MRSPWLGVVAILVAGVAGYALSDGAGGTSTLDAVRITIRPTRDNGAAWDFGGGLPDPRVTVDQGGTVLATCELKDQLEVTCKVGAHVDRDKGPVRVVVIDVDSSDPDTVGETVLDLDQRTTTGSGALQTIELATTGGGHGPWQRFRALWIALAIGIAVALALAVYRKRHA